MDTISSDEYDISTHFRYTTGDAEVVFICKNCRKGKAFLVKAEFCIPLYGVFRQVLEHLLKEAGSCEFCQ